MKKNLIEAFSIQIFNAINFYSYDNLDVIIDRKENRASVRIMSNHLGTFNNMNVVIDSIPKHLLWYVEIKEESLLVHIH